MHKCQYKNSIHFISKTGGQISWYKFIQVCIDTYARTQAHVCVYIEVNMYKEEKIYLGCLILF